MSDAEQLSTYVQTWKDACDRFISLTREIPESQMHAPTDLPGWDVRANVAHTAHLEAVLDGTPEETLEVGPADHLRTPMAFYTEQGVLARRDRSLAELADEIDAAVAHRYQALLEDPPTDASAAPPKTPGDIGWDWGTLLSNRALDVWMHEQDVRRALHLPGGYDAPAATHVIGVFGRGLGLVWGKRVAPGPGRTLTVDLTDRPEVFTVTVGQDGRARPATEGTAPDLTLRMPAETFVVLAGGRQGPDGQPVQVEGDPDLAKRTLAAMTLTP